MLLLRAGGIHAEKDTPAVKSAGLVPPAFLPLVSEKSLKSLVEGSVNVFPAIKDRPLSPRLANNLERSRPYY